ncbi:MAG: hypothetical protein GMKNLPBB_01068 [Myxococcota bacterium]|nr:hypothetical protein [Myxococcota bacterium]
MIVRMNRTVFPRAALALFTSALALLTACGEDALPEGAITRKPDAATPFDSNPFLCTTNLECTPGQECINGQCVLQEIPPHDAGETDAGKTDAAPADGGGGDSGGAESCTKRDDCPGGHICFGGKCIPDPNAPDSGPGDSGGDAGDTGDAQSSSDPDIDLDLTPSGGKYVIDFGPVVVGAPVSRTFTVTNKGLGELKILSLVISKGIAAGFAFKTNPVVPKSIQAGNSWTYEVVFSAANADPAEGAITLASNDPDEGTLEIQLTTTVKGKAKAQAEPAELDFGEIRVGVTAERTVKIKNATDGDAVLRIDGLAAKSAGVFAWVPDASRKFPIFLNPNEQREFKVSYAPKTAGQSTDSIQVNTNGEPAALDIPVKGNAVSSALKIDPSPVDLGEVAVGAAAEKEVTLSNDGAAELRVTALAIAKSTEFKLVSPPALPLKLTAKGTKDAEARLRISFTPAKAGSFEAELRIENDGPTSPNTVKVIGKAISPPKMELSSNALQFGNVAIGSKKLVEFRVSNKGGSPLEVASVKGKVNAADQPFSWTPRGPFTVAPAASVTIQAAFEPKSKGAVTEILEFEANDPQSASLTVTMIGAGAEPDIRVSPSSVDLVSGVGSSKTGEITIRNVGDAPLTIRSVKLTGADCAEFSFAEKPTDGSVLAAGASFSVKVTYRPTNTQDDSCNVDIESNDTDASTVRVALSGKGAAPEIEVKPAELKFGNVNVGTTSAPQDITINNLGNATLSLQTVTTTGSCANFTRTSPGTSVNAGASAKITVTYKPVSAITETCFLNIRSNDADEPQVIVQVNGAGVTSGVNVNPASIDFGTVPLTTTREIAFEIQNTGGATLTVSSITSSCTEVTVAEPPTAPIPPAGKHSSKAVFDPAGKAVDLTAKACKLTINNDSAVSKKDVPVRGRSSDNKPEARIQVGTTLLDPNFVYIVPFNDTLKIDGSRSIAQGGASIASYAWKILEQPAGGTKTPGTGASWDLKFDLYGTYRVELVVTDSNGQASAPTVVSFFVQSTVLLDLTYENIASNDADKRDVQMAFYHPGIAGNASSSSRCHYGNQKPNWGDYGWSQGTTTWPFYAIPANGAERIEYKSVPASGAQTFKIRSRYMEDCKDYYESVIFGPTCFDHEPSKTTTVIKINGVEKGVCCRKFDQLTGDDNLDLAPAGPYVDIADVVIENGVFKSVTCAAGSVQFATTTAAKNSGNAACKF